MLQCLRYRKPCIAQFVIIKTSARNKMAPTKKEKVVFKCREVTCAKTFTFRQNRHKHEKKFNHMPVKRRLSTLFPLYNADSKTYHCPKSGCKSSSKYKRSITRHIKEGCTLNRKAMVKNNRTCEFCGMTFERKSNCDRHVKTIHANDTLMPVLSMVGSPEKCATMNVDERKNEREILDLYLMTETLI